MAVSVIHKAAVALGCLIAVGIVTAGWGGRQGEKEEGKEGAAAGGGCSAGGEWWLKQKSRECDADIKAMKKTMAYVCLHCCCSRSSKVWLRSCQAVNRCSKTDNKHFLTEHKSDPQK